MRKVLIVTYYWPPAGGPGVQRWLKFVKYLQDFDVQPVVYVPQNPNYPIIDESFNDEVPAGIKILKNRIFEPYALAGIFSRKDTETISSGIIKEEKDQSLLQKLMLYIRGNYFIPDARKYWIKPSVKYLKNELAKNDYDAIITTGPPHSLHLIGLGLKKELKIKWIADFRDPWTQIGYHKKLKLSPAARKKHEELERDVLKSADHIITTSFTTQKEFQDKTTQPVTVITNGYDEDIKAHKTNNNKFQISHIGSLLSGRNPGNLWKILNELINENEQFNDHFELRLAGKISEDVLGDIRSYGLSEHIITEGYVSHTEALKMQRESSILLLVEIDSEETRGIIPGKLFEYLAAGKPILAVGPQSWDVERIIVETKTGEYFRYDEPGKMKNYILELFQKFMKNEPVDISSEIEQFHRRTLTKKLANLINKV